MRSGTGNGISQLLAHCCPASRGGQHQGLHSFMQWTSQTKPVSSQLQCYHEVVTLVFCLLTSSLPFLVKSLSRRPGEIVISLGTSATLFGVAAQPVIDPTCAVCPFCDATGAWLPLICTLNCTVPAEEVCAAFQMSHDDITRLAESQPAGAGGVNFLPYLLGERTPNWPNSSGAVLGLKPGGAQAASGRGLSWIALVWKRGRCK